MTVSGKIRSGLTRFYAKGRGGVTDTEEYTASGISRTVYWFHDESQRMGDYSPIGTVLLNEQVKEDFSKDVVDYVFLHEVGHDQIGSLWRTLFWVLYLLFGLLFLSGVIALPSILYSAIQYAPSTVMIPLYLVSGLGISVAACLPFVVVSWSDETLAELFAISKIGRDQYRAIREEAKAKSNDGILYKIKHRIQYPPESLILWIARKRGIGDP